MNKNFIKLYSAGQSPDSAFLLTEGFVFFYASQMDKYSINGKNLIVGSTELIMKHILHEPVERAETAITDQTSTLKKMK